MGRDFRGGLATMTLCMVLALGACKPSGPKGGATEPVGEGFMDEVHAQCLKSGGEYLRLGNGGFVCQAISKDAGKSCDSAADCDGVCLARSRTCAPVRPLMGCNEVLTESGVAVTQCID